jgi:hypothetical protein
MVGAEPPFVIAGAQAYPVVTYNFGENRIYIGLSYSGGVARVPSKTELENTCELTGSR